MKLSKTQAGSLVIKRNDDITLAIVTDPLFFRIHPANRTIIEIGVTPYHVNSEEVTEAFGASFSGTRQQLMDLIALNF